VSVRIELLWCEGCPSYEQALAELREVLAELGRPDATVTLHKIADHQQAVSEGFVGAPTIRVDGCDVLAPDADEPVGLTCRVYRLRDGRPSPTPDRDDLREALAAALALDAGGAR